ncbi:MAG: SAM-dependent methyltransferase, partial [Bacteroidota bacterium]
AVIIQTPFKSGKIYENPNIITEEERLKHFGQEDHVRIYSKEGLKERLEAVGFKVSITEFSESEDNIHGFKEKEVVLIARKIASSQS